MTDLPVPDTDPPGDEGSLPDLSKLQIDESTKEHKENLPDLSMLHLDDNANEEKMCLSGLHQFYIDRICKHLDLKSIVRLQMTCKDLSNKGFFAQRLITHPLEIRYVVIGWLGQFVCASRTYRNLLWNEKQFKALNCRFQTRLIFFHYVTLSEAINCVTEALEDRGTIERLQLHSLWPVEADRLPFDQLLQDWKIPELEVGEMPPEFFQLPGVKQLKKLRVGAWFPLSVIYLLDTDIHTCYIDLDLRRRDRPDSEEMRDILKKWAKNEKIIKNFYIGNFNFDDELLLPEWKILKHGEEIPPERPLVIWTDVVFRKRYRVIRADGTVLSMTSPYFGLALSVVEEDRPFSEDEVKEATN